MVEVISDEPWDHTLYAVDGRLVLSVWCDGIGSYDLCIELTPYEATKYERLGLEGIRWLIKDVRYRPRSYAQRRVSDPSSSEDASPRTPADPPSHPPT